MAIDTALKRKSISGITPSLIPGVTPDAAVPVAWRQASGWGYPGIPSSAPVFPPVADVEIEIVYRDMPAPAILARSMPRDEVLARTMPMDETLESF